jgi:hypothetical protein
MGLLRADLQALRNGLRSDGRGSLAGRWLPPTILALMHWLLGNVLLQHRELLHVLHRGGDPIAYLLASALAPGPVVAGWIGFAMAQRQLFEAPELLLWQAAPLWRGRAALQVLLRAVGNALLWTTALSAPLLVQLLLEAGAGAAAFMLLPLALVAVCVPSLCIVVAVQIVLLRLAHGRVARLFTAVTSTLAAFGFPVFLLAQVFAGGQSGADQLVRDARGGSSAGQLTGAAARLLQEATAGSVSAGALLDVLLPLLLGAALVAVAVPLHARAVQNHQLARTARSARHSRWPARPMAVLRRKEWAQLLQQPGAILHMVLVGALVHLFAAKGTLVHGLTADAALPAAVQQVAAMLTLWFVAVLMLLYSHMGRLAAWDGAQWPLYVQAPVEPRALLAAKLQVIASLLAWPMFVAGWAGVQWLDADAASVLPFIGFAAAGSLAALAVVAAVGTWPWLVRAEPDGRLTQGSRGLVGSLVLVFAFYFALSPALVAWLWLLQRYRVDLTIDRVPEVAEWAPAMLLAAFGFAALLLAAALLVSTRNYRRMLAAR